MSRGGTHSQGAYTHPTAYVDAGAEIGAGVRIGPCAYVGPNCRIGDGTILHNNVTIFANTHMGSRNVVYPGAVVGGLPQDRSYHGEHTLVIMGDDNTVREGATINSGTWKGDGTTRIGSRNLIMANCHIAHDCVLEDEIVMANSVLLGGHVMVESNAAFGGLSACHHFVTVGRLAFVGGVTRVSTDVPPFMLAQGIPMRVWKENRIGLKRAGLSPERIQALREAHRAIFRHGVNRSEAVAELEAQGNLTEEVRYLLEFLHRAERGNQGRQRQPPEVEVP